MPDSRLLVGSQRGAPHINTPPRRSRSCFSSLLSPHPSPPSPSVTEEGASWSPSITDERVSLAPVPHDVAEFTRTQEATKSHWAEMWVIRMNLTTLIGCQQWSGARKWVRRLQEVPCSAHRRGMGGMWDCSWGSETTCLTIRLHYTYITYPLLSGKTALNYFRRYLHCVTR